MSASSPVVSAQVFVGLGGGADDSWPPAYGRSRSPIGTRDSGLHAVIGGAASGKTAVADAPMTGFFDVILLADIGVPVLSNFSCFHTC
ncbi:MAG: hypothetical protein DWI50_02035 [Chloroflexi bacterium]|nr:MAG: hypothetical protein DWI50_02035 [Chloroflexota bacterium]